MYSDIVPLLESEDSVSLDTVREWIATADLQLWGAAYFLMERERIAPAMPESEAIDFTRRYLIRCIDENPRPGDHLHGGYQAAWALAAKLKAWRVASSRTGATLRGISIELEKMYRRGDAALRNRILCGVLEHAFEEAALRPYFAGWERDLELREAYRLAAEWGEAHQR